MSHVTDFADRLLQYNLTQVHTEEIIGHNVLCQQDGMDLYMVRIQFIFCTDIYHSTHNTKS